MVLSRKQKRNWIIFGSVFLAIILVVILLNVVDFGDGQALAISGTPCFGGQVLSIDDANIRFSSELNKEVIRIRFSTVPTSECLDIRISPLDLEKELEENGVTNFDVTKSIIGDINLVKKNIEFTIFENQNNQYKQFLLNNKGGQLFCTSGDCPGAFASLRDGAPLNLRPPCICASDDIEGIDAEFSSGSNLIWQTEISIGGDTITLENGDLSGEVGNIAFVKWSGNLAGNIGFSRPNRDAYKPFNTNQFIMVEPNTFQSLDNSYSNNRVSLVNSDKRGLSSADELDDARAYNSRFNEDTQDGLNLWISQEPTVDNAEIVSNKLIVGLKSPIVYPTFILDIVAEEVGIFITTGKPDVTCPSNFNILSGQTSDQTFQLRNVGQGSGSFDYSISCNKGSQILQPSPPRSIGKDNILNIVGTIGLTVEEGKETASCTFRAKELNTLEENSCSFSYTSTKQTQCIEGTKTCEIGNTQLWTCLAGGTFGKKVCEFGCTKVGEEFICSEEDDGEDGKCESNNAYVLSRLFGGLFTGLRCTPNVVQILAFIPSLIKFIVVPITFIFALIFSFNFFQTSKIGGINNKGIAFLVSFILAGIIAVLVWFLFWIGVIIFVVLIILWFYLGRFIPKGPRRKIESGITKCKEGFKLVGNSCVRR